MATVKTVLHTSKKYKNGKSPIMLRITKGSDLKYFKIGDEKFDILANQWNREFGLVKADKRINPEHRFINDFIKEKQSAGVKIIRDFEEKGFAWTFNMFEQEYQNKPKITKVKPFIETRVKELKEQGKYKSADGLGACLKRLENYYSNFDKLYFQDIDYSFIEGFYLYLKNERKNRDTTIGIELRSIRGILNDAIDQGVGSKEAYPFSKIYGATKVFKISKLEKCATKRFIPKDYMIKLVDAEILEYHLNWARQMFLFSFFASGVNFKDMAFLKEANVETKYLQDGQEQKYLIFKRLKTNEGISVPITEPLKKILLWAMANSTNNNEYLLPIITNHKLTGEKLTNHINQRRKRLNMHLRTIAGNLKFPTGLLNLSSYYARHSYATTMLRNGVQVEKISEALGHTSIKTTQIYLESFGIDELTKLNENLLK